MSGAIKPAGIRKFIKNLTARGGVYCQSNLRRERVHAATGRIKRTCAHRGHTLSSPKKPRLTSQRYFTSKRFAHPLTPYVYTQASKKAQQSSLIQIAEHSPAPRHRARAHSSQRGRESFRGHYLRPLMTSTVFCFHPSSRGAALVVAKKCSLTRA